MSKRLAAEVLGLDLRLRNISKSQKESLQKMVACFMFPVYDVYADPFREKKQTARENSCIDLLLPGCGCIWLRKSTQRKGSDAQFLMQNQRLVGGAMPFY